METMEKSNKTIVYDLEAYAKTSLREIVVTYVLLILEWCMSLYNSGVKAMTPGPITLKLYNSEISS